MSFLLFLKKKKKKGRSHLELPGNKSQVIHDEAKEEAA